MASRCGRTLAGRNYSTIGSRRLVDDAANDELLEHSAIAMQEHHRGPVAALDVVQPCSACADEATQWRILAFGLLGMPLSEQRGSGQTNAGNPDQAATDSSGPGATRYRRPLSKCATAFPVALNPKQCRSRKGSAPRSIGAQ